VAGGGSSTGDWGSDGQGKQEGSKGHVPGKPSGGGAHHSWLSTVTAEMKRHGEDSSSMA
jgi:hypothetical protein